MVASSFSYLHRPSTSTMKDEVTNPNSKANDTGVVATTNGKMSTPTVKGDDETSIPTPLPSKSVFKSLPLFVVNLSVVLFFYMINAVYYGGVVRTIERRFGLRSAETGFIGTVNDFVHVAIVVFVGYFGRKAHKPRILSVTMLFMAVAALLNASPHFILADDGTGSGSSSAAQIYSNDSSAPGQFCIISDGNSSKENGCGDGGLTGGSGGGGGGGGGVHPAFYIFVISQLFSGIGGSGIHTLSLAYIDENAPKDKSALYLGFILGTKKHERA